LIFDIKRARPESQANFCLTVITLYSSAFCLASSTELTDCRISQPSTTLSSHTIKTGSPGLANLTD